MAATDACRYAGHSLISPGGAVKLDVGVEWGLYYGWQMLGLWVSMTAHRNKYDRR